MTVTTLDIEPVAARAEGGQVAAWPGGHLDVEAERALDLRDEVRKRPGDVLAQPPGLVGQGGQPGVADLRVLAGVAEVVERFDQ